MFDISAPLLPSYDRKVDRSVTLRQLRLPKVVNNIFKTLADTTEGKEDTNDLIVDVLVAWCKSEDCQRRLNNHLRM